MDIVGGKGQKYQYKSNFSVLRLLQNPDFLKWETYEGIAKPFIKRDKTILFEVVPFNNLYDIL